MNRISKATSLGVLVIAVSVAMAAAAVAAPPVERPYKGNEQVVVTIDLASCESPLGPCEFTTVSAGGTSSHLGKTSTTSEGLIFFDAEPCVLSDGSFGGGFSTSGTFDTTAANGDMLFGEFENEGCADLDGLVAGSIEGTQTIVDGTGRFDGATGSTVTFGDNLGPLFWIGTLTY